MAGRGKTENLIKPSKDLTAEEQRKRASKAGKASAKKRRERKEMRETLAMLLSMPLKDNASVSPEEVKSYAALKGKNITVSDAMACSMINSAIKGNVKAFNAIIGIMGEKPAKEIDVTVNTNPFADLTTEELRKLADG